MEDAVIEDIYYTLIGELEPEYRVLGVEDAFAPGSVCDQAYADLSSAAERLRRRMGTTDEDPDVEALLLSTLDIQKDLCLRMFRLGQAFHP